MTSRALQTRDLAAIARGLLCLCTFFEPALASPPSPAAFEAVRPAWIECPYDPDVTQGIGSHPQPAPPLLRMEPPGECLLTTVATARLAPPSGPLPMPAQPRASGPLWGIVSELRLGVFSHDVAFTGDGALTFPNPLRHRHEGGVNVSGEIILVSPSFLRSIGSPRPRVGASLSLAGYTDHVYADLDWGYALRAGPFAEAFFGGAWHDGALRQAAPRHSELGTRLLFHIGLEGGWRLQGRQSVSVIWEHLSNGSLARPNEGIDSFGVRYGYRFD